jgi:hypothetical protein
MRPHWKTGKKFSAAGLLNSLLLFDIPQYKNQVNYFFKS